MTGAAPTERERVLIVIPARGGSKGIPRKNLRTLAGRPLIAYVIETALASRHPVDVVVTSDDAEILNVAGKLGAIPHHRPATLADDKTTLDQVIIGSVPAIEAQLGRTHELVVTVQPTSPMLAAATLDEAIDMLLADPDLDTILTAVDDTHLTWSQRDGQFVPNYTKRVNRQQLEPVFRETGALIACRAATLATGSRIGPRVALLPVSGGEAIDIDSREDWALAAWALAERDLLFVVVGNEILGLGHVHNALTIANELVTHRVRFLVTEGSELARDILAAHHYEVHIQRTADLVAEILQLGPDVVVNDRLDTTAEEVDRLRAAGCTVISFEDLGSGAAGADLVINGIYPEQVRLPNHYFGSRYVCLRAEFALTEPRPIGDQVHEVLVTFGGVDPNNLTLRVVAAIHDECVRRGIVLSVVAGRGYGGFASLAGFPGIRVDRAVVDMADRMRAADIAFTSAGRTIFEIASIGTPAIVLAQNDRELTHLFASDEHGFRHLGLGVAVSDDQIRAAFLELANDAAARRRMQTRMLDNDIRSGTSRVVQLIERTLEEHGSR